MKTSILIIEDIPEMADLMAMYLENDNFDTVKCESAEKAIEQLSNGYNPALVLLDINLPRMSGFDFLKEFREKTSTVTPVIIVSARDADEDIIEGLGLGADEFVTKPFSPKVLVARVKAKLSRLSATEASVEETISFGPYTIFLNSCILKRGNEKIPLSTKEYEVLEFMARNPGKEMSPDTIYSGVWKNHFGDISAVAVYIQRLRKKIEDNPSSPKYLCTVFGMGYKFEAN